MNIEISEKELGYIIMGYPATRSIADQVSKLTLLDDNQYPGYGILKWSVRKIEMLSLIEKQEVLTLLRGANNGN